MSLIRIKSTRRLAALLALPAVFSFSGCGSGIYENYRDITSLQLVQAVGIDHADGMYNVTVSTGQGLEGESAIIISRPGESYVSAEEAIQDFTARESLFFGNARYVVFGEGAAKVYIPDFLDHLARGSSMRMDMSMFVTADGGAKALFVGSGTKAYDITEALASIETISKRQTAPVAFTCREVAASLCEYGGALICAVETAETEGSVIADTGEKVAVPAGYAIIGTEGLIGYLDRESVTAANILLERSGMFSLVLPLEDELKITFSALEGGVSYKAEWGPDGSLKRLSAEITSFGRILEMSGPSRGSQEEFLAQVKSGLEKQLEESAKKILTLSQDYECDFLGLRGPLRKAYPAQVSALGNDFVAQLAAAEIEVRADVTISESYDVDGVRQVIEEAAS